MGVNIKGAYTRQIIQDVKEKLDKVRVLAFNIIPSLIFNYFIITHFQSLPQ